MPTIKCKKCNSEWTVNEKYSVSIANCPFCGASLIEDMPNAFESVQDCLKALIGEYGKEVLADGKKLYSFLTDYIPEKRKELRILKTVCEANAYAPFVSVEQGQCDRERKRAIKILSDDYMIAEIWASKAIEWVLQAIGFSTDNTQYGKIEGPAEDGSVLPSENDIDSGNAIAEYNLGLDYYYGGEVKQNYKYAVEYFIKAAEKGNADAQNMLGVCYSNGQGIRKNCKKAVEFFKLAAEQGNAIAQYNLGNCYKNGTGVAVSEKKSAEWFLKAANQGDADAQNSLGVCYANGQGVSVDKKEAAEWFLKAANQGNVSAQSNLADCYNKGNGVPLNKKEAFKWYKKAAEQDDAGAQFVLGYFYDEGCGVAKNSKKAVEWYLKAAEQGHSLAQYSLGECYENGEGVKQDIDKAVVWYSKSAHQGVEEAQTALQRLGVKSNEYEPDDVFRWDKNVCEKDTISFSWAIYDVKIVNGGTLRIKKCGEEECEAITPSMIKRYSVEPSGIFKKGRAVIYLKGDYVSRISPFAGYSIGVSYNLKKENIYEALVLTDIMEANGIEVDYI